LPVAPEEIALLVGLNVTGRGSQRPPAEIEPELITGGESMEELTALAATAGARVAETIIQSRLRPDAATMVDSGKVDELTAKIHFNKDTMMLL
jgi:50S ribosomal subunit-associated GTPase HflX